MKKTILLVLIMLYPCAASAAIWYVDKDAAGSANGTSWDNAWASIGGIAWGGIQPGDTVYISGGETSKTYSERLVVGASGTTGNVITVQTGQDAGHNGVVILDGASISNTGLAIANKSYVKISGNVGGQKNLRVQNFYYSGGALSGTLTGIEVEYVEFTQNVRVMAAGSAGVYVSAAEGSTYEIHNCSIHNQRFSEELWISQVYTGTVGSFDLGKIHDCDIYDFHGDAVKMAGEGTSFYNNTIRDRGTFKNDHPDGIQLWNGYTKIYNNTFFGFHNDNSNNINSYIRYNPGGSGKNPNPRYTYIYNNLFYEAIPMSFKPADVVTDGGVTYTCTAGNYSSEAKRPPNGTYWSVGGAGGSPWAAGTDYSAETEFRRGVEFSFSGNNPTTVRDIIFANNTMVGVNFFGFHIGFDEAHDNTDISGIIIANNVFKDVSYASNNLYGSNYAMNYADRGDGTVTYGSAGSGANVIIDHNIIYGSDNTWSTRFGFDGAFYTSIASVASAAGTDNNSFILNPDLDNTYAPSVSSPAIDNGMNLSAYFTTDRLGKTRSAPWDIGSYEYGGIDTTPNAFSFTDNTGAALSTVIYSTSVTVAGIDNTTAISLTGAGCEYRVNAGSWITSGDNVALNDNIALRTTSSGSYNTAVSCVLTIGGVSDTWSVTTSPAAEVPTAPRMRCGTMTGGWK